MQLHFETQGRGDPVVILHGLLGSLDNWRTVSAGLARHYRVLAVDLRNHGRSPRDAAMDYGLMAEDVRELLDGQGLARTRLLGHSMGGKVAMEFALRHPDRVERLIVADMAPRAYPSRHSPIFHALLAVDLAACSSRSQIDAALTPALPDRALRQFLLKGAVRDESGAFSWKFNLAAIRGHYEDLRGALPEGRVCGQPALFIRGGASDHLGDADFGPIRQLFPQARFHTIAGAGHWVHIDASAEFLRVVFEAFAEEPAPVNPP